MCLPLPRLKLENGALVSDGRPAAVWPNGESLHLSRGWLLSRFAVRRVVGGDTGPDRLGPEEVPMQNASLSGTGTRRGQGCRARGCHPEPVAVFAATTSPAAAKIRCKGIFQVTKNGLISTSRCRDREIARTARSYGWRVSDAEVSNNPLKKVRICQALGGDTRLKGACGAYGARTFR